MSRLTFNHEGHQRRSGSERRRFCIIMACVIVAGGLSACQPNAHRAKTTHTNGASNLPQFASSDLAQGTVTSELMETYPSGKPTPDEVRETLILLQAQYPEEKIIERIRSYPGSYQLEAEDILYLNDLGVSTTVIAEMVRADVAQGWQDAGADQVLNDLREVDNSVADLGSNPASVNPDPDVVPGRLNEETVPESSDDLVTLESQQVSEQVAPTSAEASVPVDESPTQISGPALDFYEPLSPYGNWIYVTDIGWCWRPTVASVNLDWAPYRTHGRWVYTDYGWYWDSYYSWGWAPFHYGRWARHGSYGWVWRPGRAWGPAWVTWRYNSAYCGWAPLPPRSHYVAGTGFFYRGSQVGAGFGFGIGYYDYTFLPYSRFHGYRVERYAVYGSRGRDIYSNSVIINNYVIGDNNTIINQGVGLTTVESRIGKSIQKTPVRMETVPENPIKLAKVQTRPAGSIVAHQVPVNSDKRPVPVSEANRVVARPVVASTPNGSRSNPTTGAREIRRSSSSDTSVTSAARRVQNSPSSSTPAVNSRSRASSPTVDRSGMINVPSRTTRSSQYVTTRQPTVRSNRPSVTPESRPARTPAASRSTPTRVQTPSPRVRSGVSASERTPGGNSSIVTRSRSGGFQTRSATTASRPSVTAPTRNTSRPSISSPRTTPRVAAPSSSRSSRTIRVSPSRIQSRQRSSSPSVTRPTPSPRPSPSVRAPSRNISTPTRTTRTQNRSRSTTSRTTRPPSTRPSSVTGRNNSTGTTRAPSGSTSVNVSRGGFQSPR